MLKNRVQFLRGRVMSAVIRLPSHKLSDLTASLAAGSPSAQMGFSGHGCAESCSMKSTRACSETARPRTIDLLPTLSAA
jgi:hypothetical protein